MTHDRERPSPSAIEADAPLSVAADAGLSPRERLLDAVARATGLLLHAEDVSRAIGDAIRIIGEAAGVSRVKVFLERSLEDGSGLAHDLAHEWWAPGVVSQRSLGLTVFPNATIEAPLASWRAHSRFWRRLDDWPDKLKLQFEQAGIRSLGVVPITAKGAYVGCIAFDDCLARSWTEVEIDVLTVAAQAIGAAFYRRTLEEAADQRAAALQRMNEVLTRCIEAPSRAADAAPTADLAVDWPAGQAQNSGGAIVRQVIREMAAVLGTSSAGVFSVLEDRLQPTGEYLLRGTWIRHSAADDILLEHAPFWPELASGASCVYDAERDSERFTPWLREFMRRTGHRWVLNQVIRVNETPKWLLVVVGDDPEPLTAWNLALFNTLAGQLTLALELARLAGAEHEQRVSEERTRIAREVHDTIAQGLAGIVMQLGAARAKLGSGAARAAPELERIERLARENLAEARRTIAMLHPKALERNGLIGALRRAVEVFRESNREHAGGSDALSPKALPNVRFRVAGEPRRLPADVELELFRIGQAALVNAVAHASARTIHVDLVFDVGDGARVTVTDDGCGFDLDAPHPGRFGLVGMAERAARIGAVLTLASAPSEGTEVVVRWCPPPVTPR